MDSFEEAQYVYERDSFYYLLNMMRLNLAIEELKDEQKVNFLQLTTKQNQ